MPAGEKRVLITGAAGALGRVLRAKLKHDGPVRSSDIAPMQEIRPDEELVQGNLADFDFMCSLCEGVDTIVHLGGHPREADWETIHQSNIIGAYNTYEAARRAGVRRLIFASSNHAIGFHRVTSRLDSNVPPRADGLYGASKVFMEQLGLLYAYKHNISGLMIRIGSCRERPNDRRSLSTWLSYPDFVHLIEVGIAADYLYEIVYGVSANTRSWWDNSRAYALGYRPKDNAEQFAAEVEDNVLPGVAGMFQGGAFASDGFAGDAEAIP